MPFDVRGRDEHDVWHQSPAHRHLVQFYESDEYLLLMLSQFVTTTLRGNEAGIVVATAPHVARLKQLLTQNNLDVNAAQSSGQLLFLDAEDAMSRFMVNGEPDSHLFRTVFGGIINDVKKRWPDVRVYGEMVALTAEVNFANATLDLEMLWNELLESYNFSLCCAYPLRTFDHEDTADMLLKVCDQHSIVFPAESYTGLKSDEERFREITLLQQKASQLETEVKQHAMAQEQLHKALDAEREARQEAEAALSIRDEFVSIAAHELKTPLTSLIGRAQLAVKRIRTRQYQDPAQVENLMQSVVTQAEKLSRLIGQLLDVSRLKGGKLLIQRETVDLVELINESVNSVYVSQNSHTINVSAPDRMVAEVDPIRLEQVIINLLNNAVKYSPPESEVRISLKWPDDSTVELTVLDQGPGIPVAEREHIFERFYQGGKKAATGAGMGLGLYISREIVELHGGDVLAEFPETGGTRFIVRLPISPYHTAATEMTVL